MLQLTPNRDWQDYAGEYIPRTRGEEEINPTILYNTPHEIVSNQQSERNIYAYDPNHFDNLELDERAEAFCIALNLFSCQFRGGPEHKRDYYVGVQNLARMFGVPKSTAMNYYAYGCRKGLIIDCGVYKHYDAPLKNYDGYLHTTIWAHNISIYKANKLRTLLKNAPEGADKLQIIIDFCDSKDKAVVRFKELPQYVNPIETLKIDHNEQQIRQQHQQQYLNQFVKNFKLNIVESENIDHNEQQAINSRKQQQQNQFIDNLALSLEYQYQQEMEMDNCVSNPSFKSSPDNQLYCSSGLDFLDPVDWSEYDKKSPNVDSFDTSVDRDDGDKVEKSPQKEFIIEYEQGDICPYSNIPQVIMDRLNRTRKAKMKRGNRYKC